jgi:hypothetical protein
MAGFSITEVGFTGFRVVREHPRAVLFWAAAELVFMILLTLALGPMVNTLTSLPPEVWRDSKRLSAAIEPYAGTADAVWLLLAPFNAVLNAAMNRAVMRPDQDRFGYLRLGLDELRQLGLILILLALVFVGATLVGILVQFGGPALGALALTAAIALWIVGGLRLSLASALTFDRRQIDLVGAWRLTQGRLMPLVAAYALAAAMSIVVFLLTSAVTEAAVALASLAGGDASQAARMPTSLSAFLRPAEIVNLVLGAVSVALMWPVWLTPPAAIYLRLRDKA